MRAGWGECSIHGKRGEIMLIPRNHARKIWPRFVGAILRGEKAFELRHEDRARFERELERLRSFEAAAVVVESPLASLVAGDYKSAMDPKAAYESCVAFMARYKLTFYFAQDRRGAERFTHSFLRHFLRTVEKRYRATVVSVPVRPKISIASMVG